jgi:uncharacterized membrane protein YhaH (DUF805 family)
MNWLYLFNSATGRISRQPFLIGILVLGLVEIVTEGAVYQLAGEKPMVVLDLAFTYPEFMLTVKRANDRNMPTFVIALFFIVNGIVDFLTLIGWQGDTVSDNPVFVLMQYAWLAFAAIMIVELCIRRGTVGANRFGPDPLETKP